MAVISNETTNELTIYPKLSKRHNVLLTGINFFVSSAGKFERVMELKLKLFE